MSTRLIELVEKLPGRRIALLGDLMIDRYLYGHADRLSPEAPVPVLHYQREQAGLGGAGRVAAGIASLGGEVRMIGLVGTDDAGRQVRQLLTDCGAQTDLLLETSERPTICKVRLVGLAQHRHPQQMMRLDYEDPSPLDGTVASQVLEHVSSALDSWAEVLCIEDYGKGLISEEICRRAIEMARGHGIPVLVDPAPIRDFSRYAGATALKPNRFEAEHASHLPTGTPQEYARTAQWLLDELKLEAALITLDRSGVYVATRQDGSGGPGQWIQSRARQVYDVTGAGDMFLAMLCLARASGAAWGEAATLANVAGGLECEKFGSVPITRPEIIQELLLEAREHLGKQRTLDQLVPELAQHRSAGRKIVFTNGCFDLVHLGHIKYFQFAKAQGDLLVVGVNTDDSIQRLKGPKRPIINQHDRLSVLEELESIDYLVCFDEDTPVELIRAIRPDVLVKGADYSKQQVVGWDVVEAYGGHVALAPLVDGRSTSALIRRILDVYSGS